MIAFGLTGALTGAPSPLRVAVVVMPKCVNCAAPLESDGDRCVYCGSGYRLESWPLIPRAHEHDWIEATCFGDLMRSYLCRCGARS